MLVKVKLCRDFQVLNLVKHIVQFVFWFCLVFPGFNMNINMWTINSLFHLTDSFRHKAADITIWNILYETFLLNSTYLIIHIKRNIQLNIIQQIIIILITIGYIKTILKYRNYMLITFFMKMVLLSFNKN